MNGYPPCCINCGKGVLSLEGTYDVYLGKEVVGNVTVTKEGLYYRFACSCHLSTDVCKLKVSCDEKEEILGTLVPSGSAFCLNTRLPAKRLGNGRACFSVVPNRPIVAGKFVPLCPEEPFAYLERLKDAYLAHRNGQLGVMIKENKQ